MLSALPSSINNQGLFSSHYLAERLPRLPEWEGNFSKAFASLKKLYAAKKAVAPKWNEAQTEEEFIKPVLEILGWEYIVQATYTKRGRQNKPDYALFGDKATKTKAYTHKDDPLKFYALALGVCDAKYWGRSLDAELTGDTRDAFTNANPSFQIVNYLVGTDVAWGILTNGQSWRLYAQRVRSRITTFFEINLAEALATDDDRALRYFVLLFGSAAFQVQPVAGGSFLTQVQTESAEYAIAIQDELKELVFEKVAPRVVQGFVAWRQAEQGVTHETPETLTDLYKATLIFLYRLFFLFYAEARNLLPIESEHGYSQFSLTRLCQEAATQLDKSRPFGERTAKYWGALTDLFRIVAKGDPGLGVPIYNGGLFEEKPRNGHLTLRDLTLADAYLAEALEALARRYDSASEKKLFIDYKDLDVRHLGSIYEGLLEFQPQIAEENLAVKREKGKEVYARAGKGQAIAVQRGEVYLANDKGQRKSTGSYYTPDYIVKHIVANTLTPVVAESTTRFAAAMATLEATRKKLKRAVRPDVNRTLQAERQRLENEAVAALLDVKVCDPAMGSGHFLVEVVGFLTDHFAALLAQYPANPIIKLIEQTRQQITRNLTAQGITPDPIHLDDKHLLKRMVMKRCIYGVDLNLMAVELAKLSLWLDSFTVGAPLSFLDHHLKHGNSLIGTRAESVQHNLSVVEIKTRSIRERKKPIALQGDLFGSPFAGLLTAAALMRDVATLTDSTFDEVAQSVSKYSAFEQEILPYKRVLDLWLGQHFEVKESENFLRLYGNEALQAVMGDQTRISPEYREAIRQVQSLWREKRFFHWDLEFPEVFIWDLEFPEVFIDLAQSDWKERPGFDAVVSNPPYVDVPIDSFYRSHFQCAAASNLYGYMLETSGQLLAPGGQLGMIVPLSLVCADRMADLRQWCRQNFSDLRVANFGIRPAKIFPGVDQRVTILLAQKQSGASQTSGRLRATRFYHWHEGEETQLIASLSYSDITDLPQELGWAKLGDEVGRRVAHKLFSQKSVLRDYLGAGWVFYYHGIGRYWLKAYDFAPTYINADGEPGRSTTLFEITAPSQEIGRVLLAIINSSLFYWYWALYGDDFHLQESLIQSFPFTYKEGHRPLYKKLAQLSKRLMRDYHKHSILKRGKYAKGEITWQEFYPRHSKAIIDEIDDLLGVIYGLNHEEVRYLQTCDLAFRTNEGDDEP